MEGTLQLARRVLSTTPMRWISLAETLPKELLCRVPAGKEWSALSCLQHLVDTERNVFPVRVEHFLKGEDFPAFHPDAEGSTVSVDLSPLALAQEFRTLRAESLALLSKVEAADLGRKARHQELGVVTLGEMVNEWAGHDLMHTVQGERAILQPFLEGCGPWKPYFAEHAAGKER
jgi:hypothetical protein